jgi:sugar phosphate isomerase/epimerase
VSAISIATCFDYSVPIDVQLGMIKEAGFEFVSIGGNYEHSGILEGDRLKALKAQLSDKNLSVDTIHGYPMDEPDTLEINREVVKAAMELKAPVVVLHCSSFTFSPATIAFRRNDIRAKLDLFEELSRDSGVKFAFENVLPGIATDFMEEMLLEANPRYFGFCYDSSHDQIDGPRDFGLLERHWDRLIAVHISDRIMEFVDHAIPGEGFIDFDGLCARLAKADISFPLLIEVMTANSCHKDPDEFIKIAKQEAEKLYAKIHQ